MGTNTTTIQGAAATAVVRALALPEIVALIALYLYPADTLACSAVSRLLRDSFAPYVWQDLYFGPPWPHERKYFLSRCISSNGLPDIIPHTAVQNKIDARNQIMTTFKDVAPRIQALTIRNYESIFPLQLGAACFRLQSLSISGFLPEDTNSTITPAHWVNCKMMMRRNRDHLRSLSLFKWTYDSIEKPQPGQPNWIPILACTKSWNLRSLSLEKCSIRGRHMAAFWMVCSRLESLSMEQVQLHLELAHPRAGTSKHLTKRKNHLGNPTIDTVTTNRFPRLKNLTLKRMSKPHPLHQLDLLVCPFSALRTLDWTMDRCQEFPLQSFTDRLMASTWPELDTLSVLYPHICATDDQFRDILLAAKQPLRTIELHRASMSPETFDVYRTRHFSALESIDITHQSQGNTSQWTIDILTSCPNLRRLRAMCLHAEDIFQSNKPWICHGLQEMMVFINMGFQNRGNYRRFTKEELDKCRSVFKHLATLKELQVLDMLATYSNLQSYNFANVAAKPPLEDRLVSLPLRLKAGLDLLQGLKKLRMVGFWSGRHKMPMKELNWMVQHWRRLGQLAGGWIVLIMPPKGFTNSPWAREQTAWLRKRRINTTGSRNEHYQSWDPEVYDCEDWCGLSDEEDVGSSS